MDNTQYLEIQGDELYLITPLPQYGIGTAKKQLIMTKKIFKECYKRWIKNEEDEVDFIDKNKDVNKVKEVTTEFLLDFVKYIDDKIDEMEEDTTNPVVFYQSDSGIDIALSRNDLYPIITFWDSCVKADLKDRLKIANIPYDLEVYSL